MLCELSELLGDSVIATWLALNVIMIFAIMISSSVAFYHYYWPTKITFEKWQYKVGSNDKISQFVIRN